MCAFVFLGCGCVWGFCVCGCVCAFCVCVNGPFINCIHCLPKLSGMSSGPAVGLFFRFLAKLTTSSSVTGEIKMDFKQRFII